MTELRQAAQDYLATRRALGYKLGRSGQLLMDFVGYCEAAGTEVIRTETALAWARLPETASPYWWSMRLSVVRVFARWMVAFNPDTEVPPTGLLYAKQEQFRPRLCSTEEVAALMRAALAIASPLRAGTYSTLIGLLAATGMRVGEAIGLDRDAVDWDDGVVVVRWTKFNKTRELPLHASTLAALRAYAKLRQRHCPRPATAAFFVSTTGTRLIYNNVHTQFRRLVKQVGLLPQPGTGWPRPHDLRHSFAVASLVDWQRDHQDTEVFMPRLSAYLGHGEPSSTYWYLHTVPELVALAAERLEVSEEVGS